MDPTALRWHNFAEGEAQSSSRHARSPDSTSPPLPPSLSLSTPPIVRRTPLLNNNHNMYNNHSNTYNHNHNLNNNNNNNNNNNGHTHDNYHNHDYQDNHTFSRFKPKKTLDKEALAAFKQTPTYCFCKKEAVRVYTAEFGPILECALYDTMDKDNNPSKMVCGFHVHEIAWNKFIRIVDNGHVPFHDHVELSTCPFFNFTFCTMFKVENHFDYKAPSLPLCSCKRPVILTTKRIMLDDDDDDVYDMDHDNDKDDSAMDYFGPTEIGFQCKNANIDGAKPKCSWELPAKRSALPRPKQRLHTLIDQETYFNIRQETLDHIQLMKKANCYEEDDFKMIEGSDSSDTEEEDDEDDEEDTVTTTKTSFSLSSSKNRLLPTSLIPTSVMRKRPVGHCSKAANHEKERAALKAEINRMREELEMKRHLYDKLEKEKDGVERMKNEIDFWQTSAYQKEKEKETNMVFLLLARQKTKAIEQELTEIEIRRMEKDVQNVEVVDDTNCKKCRQRRIEYAVAPCYHFAYCESCALQGGFKECIVCGEHVQSIQKMYM